jgi:hypothetical protein
MILYVDGDSYTTPGLCVDQEQSYWSLFGKHINATDITNYAYSGKSNEGIFRSAVRFVLENKQSDIFLLLGFSHLARYDTSPFIPVTNPNPAEINISSAPYKEDKDRVGGYSTELLEATFYSNLVLFDTFLKQSNVKYMLHYCGLPFKKTSAPILNTLRNRVEECANVINLFQDTYTSLPMKHKIKPADFAKYGVVGHHGAEGNKVYADFLIEQYQKLY